MLDSFQITLTGGFAVFFLLISLLVICYIGSVILNCIFGGTTEISFKSEGLIQKIKRWRRKGNINQHDKQHFD